MTDVSTVVDAYIDMWNESDPARRREIIARAWAQDASYLDPHFSGDGPDGIDAMVAAVQEQFPGHRFRLAMGPEAHHDRVRFGWQLVSDASGQAVAAGTDFATLDGDGRLRDVTGFLEAAA
jgi:hypothetical protein